MTAYRLAVAFMSFLPFFYDTIGRSLDVFVYRDGTDGICHDMSGHGILDVCNRPAYVGFQCGILESAVAGGIKRAVLQYKVLPDGEWVTVKDINNPNWKMNFENPVALFGRNTINIPDLAPNTEVLIRLYLSDGVYETGDLNETMSGDTIPDTARASVSSEVTYSGGWTAPFVMRVKVSGTTRPHR